MEKPTLVDLVDGVPKYTHVQRMLSVREKMRQAGKYESRQSDRPKDGQTDRLIDRQTDKQTDGQTFSPTAAHKCRYL